LPHIRVMSSRFRVWWKLATHPTGAFAAVAGVPVDTSCYRAKHIGNSMHLANVGVVMGVAMSCLRFINKFTNRK